MLRDFVQEANALDGYRVNMLAEEVLAALWLIGYTLASHFGHEWVAFFCAIGFVSALACYIALALGKERQKKEEPKEGESNEQEG